MENSTRARINNLKSHSKEERKRRAAETRATRRSKCQYVLLQKIEQLLRRFHPTIGLGISNVPPGSAIGIIQIPKSISTLKGCKFRISNRRLFL